VLFRSEDAPEEARRFFEDNKKEMLEGTSILWEGYWSYYELIIIREESGTKSFNQEYQNNPTDEERQIFKPELFTWFDDEDIEQLNTAKLGAEDIAKDKDKRERR